MLTTDIKQASQVLKDNNIKLYKFSHNISYDTMLAQMYYDDFINNFSGCNEVQKFDNYLVIYGQDVKTTDNHFNVDYLESLDNSELVELLENLEQYHYDEDDRDDLINCLVSIDNEDYYNYHFAANYYNDLEYDYSVTGYSQGDRIKVKIVGNVEPFINEDYLTNIFFDCPISGTIDIMLNGDIVEEVYIDEFINVYDYYDKDDIIMAIDNYISNDKEYKQLLLEYLSNNLPKHLEYS